MEETRTSESIGVFNMCQSFENPAVAARRRRMEIRRLKDIANAGNSSSEPVSKRSRPITEPSSMVHGEGDVSPPESDIDVMTRSFHGFPDSNNDGQEGEVDDCDPEMEISMLDLPPYSPSLSVDSSIVSYNSEEENAVSMETDPLFESSNLPIVSEDSVNRGHRSVSSSDIDVCGFEATQAIRLPADVVSQDSGIITEHGSQTSGTEHSVLEIVSTVVDASKHNVVTDPGNIGVYAPSGQSSCVVDSNRVPPWAYTSIAGRRPEMEDAVAAVPEFFSLPCGVVGGCVAKDSQKASESSSLHFFGVYDGHGGAQASNFCKDRLHQALIEELQLIANGEGSIIDDDNQSWQRHWERALVNCFKKVDVEVGQDPNSRDECGNEEHMECCSEPVAPETVGTTAVVAIVGSCQVIVANCGDSRAVLCRAGRAIPLSVDHKPNRDDEMARIEAAGGKVIWWNGFRVLGVLAMSRAIGDRYLKPCIIPDPEITFTQRAKEDECLILASDGLWDVISNEDACNLARRCLARWYTTNANIASKPTNDLMDPAARAAANHLCKLAIQRGSSDNITVLVVDLKAKRRHGPRH
ncbi:protein phosphatase 2C 53 [Cryptomeria japonica]|uniref:protein phosphatase 2C 53 n=1 Tax=Cryptomeria japonica TaxID=3369 RepID=UPI0025ACA11F|nr:protein phosphatase 2C 53 [Cryptomeria japonica]